MSHDWHAGILTASSWHGLESVETLPDAETMIRRAQETGAWPVSTTLEALVTPSGLTVPGSAVVARYLSGERKAHAAVGKRYRPLDPEVWRSTVRAAVEAGAKPAGAFALRDGGRVLATFEIEGGNGGTGIRNYLNLVDSLDGSLAYIAGGSSIRVVCANTLAVAMGGQRAKDAAKRGFAVIRHTASVNDRARTLSAAIEEHVKAGNEVAALYREARERKLDKPDAAALFDALFPAPTEDERKDKPRVATRKDNARTEAARAMHRAENNEGATLATLWNGATWTVDRNADGTPKASRGGDSLDSLLFGSRGERIGEVRRLIEVVLRDGTTAAVEASEAARMGVDHGQIGRALMDDMLS